MTPFEGSWLFWSGFVLLSLVASTGIGFGVVWYLVRTAPLLDEIERREVAAKDGEVSDEVY